MPDDPNDPAALIFEFFYPHSPSRVWSVLASADGMAEWFIEPKGFRPVVGTLFRLEYFPLPRSKFSGSLACEVLAATTDAVLSLRAWDARSRKLLVWAVTWTLRAENGGTVVSQRHDGFDRDDPDHCRLMAMAERGWPAVMGRLGRVLNRGDLERIRSGGDLDWAPRAVGGDEWRDISR